MKDLYNQYQKSVRAFIGRKIDDEGVVEELTNDTLLAVIQSYPTFNGRSSEFSWICSIAKHKVIDYYRKKKIKTVLFSVSPMFEEIADGALNPERDVLKNELKEEIKRTFEELEEGYQRLLRLKYVDGRRVSEIAEIFKLSIKAVESRLIRAKRKFREAWIYDRGKI